MSLPDVLDKKVRLLAFEITATFWTGICVPSLHLWLHTDVSQHVDKTGLRYREPAVAPGTGKRLLTNVKFVNATYVDVEVGSRWEAFVTCVAYKGMSSYVRFHVYVEFGGATKVFGANVTVIILVT